MPPTRRRAANTSSSSSSSNRSQSTLSFGTKSRVTKPTTDTTKKDPQTKKLPSAPVVVPENRELKEPVQDDVDVDAVDPITKEGKRHEENDEKQEHIADRVVREQAKQEIQQPLLSEEEKRAKRVTGRDLRRYWDLEEKKRKAFRVHQEGLSLEEKILRHFDLCAQYGPCIGIARLKRWRRANMLNLNPPIEVLAVLLKDDGDANQRAYLDELMS